jgi:hypothetical protein
MKKDKCILRTFIIVVLTFLIGGYQTCEAQLIDGTYFYGNVNKNISLKVSNGGEDIKVTLETKKGEHITEEKGSGEWFAVNLNGADEDYDGPEGWYDVYMGDNNYVEIEIGDWSDEVSTYETIKIPIPNSDDTMLLHLNHYIETE